MSYSVRKNLTNVNKGKVGTNKPTWLVVHFVGASGQADANSRYFKNEFRSASAHYFIDPKEIVQVVEDNTPAWHVGDGAKSKKGAHNGYVKKGGATNSNSIGFELCQDTSTGKDVWSWKFHPETVKKAIWLIKQKQKQYGIDNAHVIRHFDVSGKSCPGNMMANDWAEWKAFKKLLDSSVPQTAKPSVPGNEGKPYDDDMHTVKVGETLTSIASKYGVSVVELVKWNNITDKNVIYPESKLFIKEDKKVSSSKPKPAPAPKPTPGKSIDTLARLVIDGKLGNGEVRKKNLGSQYDAVQKRVNEILNGNKSSKPSVKTLQQLVDEVNRGLHGSGRDRMRSLGSRYAEVQREVNKLYK